MLQPLFSLPGCSPVVLSGSSAPIPEMEGVFSLPHPGSPTLIYFFSPENHTVTSLKQLIEGFQQVKLNSMLISTPSWVDSSEKAPTPPWYARVKQGVSEAVQLARTSACSDVFLGGSGYGSFLVTHSFQHDNNLARGLLLEDCIPVIERNSDTSEDSLMSPLDIIETITSPTLIMHGAKDDKVDIQAAEQFQARSGARKKQFFVIPGAERGKLAEAGGRIYFETIGKFVDEVSGRNSWRERRKRFRTTLET